MYSYNNFNNKIKDLFEQIWSAENFKMFKSQMIRKNIELELQALVLLQHQLGIIKSTNDSLTDGSMNEDEIMAIVIKKSKDEYDMLMNSRNKITDNQQNDLETAKKIVKKSEKLVETIKNDLEHQDHISKKIVKETLETSSNNDRPSSAKPKPNSFSQQFEKISLNDDEKIYGNNVNKKNASSKYDHDDDDDVVERFARPASRVSSARPNQQHQNQNQQVNNLAQNYLAVNKYFY